MFQAGGFEAWRRTNEPVQVNETEVPMRVFLPIFALLFVVGCVTPKGTEYHHRPSDDAAFGPWSTSESAPSVASSAHSGSRSSGPNDGFVDFVYGAYSRYLTRIDGARCEHRPTCSRYALLAVKRHGYVVGTWMTVERLLRGGRSSVLRPLEIYKIEEGRRYYYDPVENNDFFFTQ
jgi:hypothetical protein